MKKEIAKIIHKAEYPNSFCWENCAVCPEHGNCYYLKAAEKIEENYINKQDIIDYSEKVKQYFAPEFRPVISAFVYGLLNKEEE